MKPKVILDIELAEEISRILGEEYDAYRTSAWHEASHGRYDASHELHKHADDIGMAHDQLKRVIDAAKGA